MTITVVLADDEPLVRMGLRALLDREPDLHVVGEADDGATAVDAVRRLHPDVLLLDVRMPGTSGLEALRQITADTSLAATRVVVVTTFEIDDYIAEAVRAGASGFLLKDTAPAEVVEAVRIVHDGQSLLSPAVTARLLGLFGRRQGSATETVPGMDELTPREREIVAWVAEGLSNEEIGGELFLSPATVRTHVGRAMQKTRARDRAQLVVFAIRAGLVVDREARRR